MDELLRKQFTKYVHVALTNRRIDYIRRQHTMGERENLVADIVDAHGHFDEEHLMGNAPEDFLENEGLFRAISSMNAKERIVLLLCVIEDVDPKVVAEELGLTVRRVQQIRRKVLKQLSQSLS